MQVQVTKDKVTILDKCTVKVHKGEYNINKITFDLSEEYTDDLAVNAIFSLENGKAYQMSILNNECGIPAEVLASSGIVTLGVYAYKINNDELELRYSPYPTYFTVIGGSYDPSAEESQEITPSQFEQYMQALQNGLAEVNEKLQEVIDTSIDLEENGTYAKKQGDYAKETTDELISKVENGDFNGATFTPSVSNDGDLSWSNDKGLDNPITVNIKGQKGDTGEPFTISKTYPSVEAMEADFDNMEVGDYVMIASSVDDEDNAKLYVKTDTEWVFITDFSGAIGIQGEPGVGIVSASAGNSSESDGYTITPITFMKTDNSQTTVNVSVKNGEQGPQGEKGNTGPAGADGQDGVGITTITAGTPIVEDDKTVTPITFNKTDGSTQIVNVEAQNGETQDLSGYVTNDALDNIVPKNTANGEIVSVDDVIAYKTFNVTVDGASEQETTTGKNLLPNNITSQIVNGVTVTKNDDGSITLNGTATSYFYLKFTDDPIILQPGTYIQSFHPSGSATPVGGIYINSKDSDNNQILEYSIASTISKTLDVETTIVNYNVAVNVGTVIENITLYPMLELGSQATSYEPYTGGQPSPSPDYPQPITTLTFDKITRCGKNLATENFANQNSSINLARTLKTGEKITIVVNMQATDNPPSGYGINIYDSYNEQLWGNSFADWQSSYEGWNSFVVTVKNDTNRLRINSYGYQEVEIPTAILIGALVVENKYVNDGSLYEPYQGQTYDIDLQGNEMVELRNGVKDELVIDKYGNVSLIKNVGKVVFDGSEDEDWNIDSSVTNIIQFSTPIDNAYHINSNYITAISNYFRGVGFQNSWLEDNVITISYNERLRIMTSLYATVEEFRTWLSTHNTIVYYELETPQTINLGKLTDIITTLNGTNNISINGNIPTTISTTYALDIKKYIDNKLAEISTAMIEEG